MSEPATEPATEPTIEGNSEPDQISEEDTVVESIDYYQIYDELMEKFNKVYNESQVLHAAEKVQRQTLYQYKRRKNALIDFLRSFDDSTFEFLDDLTMKIDEARIESLLMFDPSLKQKLMPILQIARDELAQDISLEDSAGLSLIVDELIPELQYDELDAAEMNPQEMEMWVRRNFSHLVVSKFKPADIRAKGVRDYVDSSSSNMKRRKRKE